MSTVITLEQLAAQGFVLASATPTPAPLTVPTAIPVPAPPVAPIGVNPDNPASRVIRCFFERGIKDRLVGPEWLSWKMYSDMPTLEELATPTRMAARPTDGKAGNHYVAVYALSDARATELAQLLESKLPKVDRPNKAGPSASRRNYQRQAAAAPVVDPRIEQLQQQLAAVNNQIAALVDHVTTPALAPVAGHSVVPPVPAPAPQPLVVAPTEVTVLVPGQPVMTLQGLRYVSEDGIRTVKTPPTS